MKKGFYDLNLEVIREMFGIGEKYETSSQFKQGILMKAQKELAALSDIYFTVEKPLKEGKKVIGWRLKIHTKNKPEVSEVLQKTSELLTYVRRQFLLKEVHIAIIEDIIHDEEIRSEVSQKVRYLAEYTSKHKPQNLQVYIIKSLLQAFPLPHKKEKPPIPTSKSNPPLHTPLQTLVAQKISRNNTST